MFKYEKTGLWKERNSPRSFLIFLVFVCAGLLFLTACSSREVNDTTPGTQEQQPPQVQGEPPINPRTLYYAKDFSDGLAWVVVRHEGVERWAAINTTGEIQFFANAEPTTSFCNGVAMLSDNSVIDSRGNIVVDNNDPRFDTITHLDSGFIWVQRRNDTLDGSVMEYGILDSSGQWFHELQADWRLTRYSDNDPWGRRMGTSLWGDVLFWYETGRIYLLDFMTLNTILRIEGRQIVSEWRDDYNEILGLRVVPDWQGQGVFASPEMRVLLISKDGSYEELPELFDGYVPPSDSSPLYMSVTINAGWYGTISDGIFFFEGFEGSFGGGMAGGFFDFRRNRLFEIPQIDNNFTPLFERDYSVIGLENPDGVRFVTIIDRQGNFQFEPIVASPVLGYARGETSRLSNGKAWVVDRDGNIVLLNTGGEIVVSLPADYSVRAFSEGFSVISSGNRFHFIDVTGERLIVH